MHPSPFGPMIRIYHKEEARRDVRAKRESVSRSMIIITIINYRYHYQSVDDDDRSNDGTKMPTRQHIFSSL